MTRVLLIAAAVAVVAVAIYVAMIDRQQPGVVTPGTAAVSEDSAVGMAGSEEIVEENVSNRAGADVATDAAVESALEGEDPVQGALERSRAAANTTGAVGAAAFTPEGYDPEAVVVAIEDSDLSEVEKARLMDLLAEADPASDELDAALTSIRAALAVDMR